MAYLERSKKPLTLFITFSSMSLMHKLIFFFFFLFTTREIFTLEKDEDDGCATSFSGKS